MGLGGIGDGGMGVGISGTILSHRQTAGPA